MGGYGIPNPGVRIPQVGSPQAGPIGGIHQAYPQPGTTPYQPNPVASVMDTFGQFLTGVGKMHQETKQKAQSDFQNFLNLKAQGLPVDDQKMVRVAKKAGLDSFFDFSDPQLAAPPAPSASALGVGMPQQPGGQQIAPPPQVGPSPQAGAPPLPGVPGGGMRPPMPQMPPQQASGAPPMPGVPGGGPPSPMPQAPPQMAAQLPQQPPPQATYQAPPVTPLPQGYGATGILARMKQALMGQPIAQDSQGANAVRTMGDQAAQSGQLQRQLTGMGVQGAMQDFQKKQMAWNVMQTAMGVGQGGKPASPQEMFQATNMAVRMGLMQKMEGDDISSLAQAARQAGTPTPKIQQGVQAWIAQKLGVDKMAAVQNDIAGKLMSYGVGPDKAYSSAADILNGQGTTALPTFTPQGIKTHVETMSKLHDDYPNVAPPVWRGVDALVLGGRIGDAYKVLGKSDTAANLKEQKNQQDQFIKQQELKLRASGLDNEVVRTKIEALRTNIEQQRLATEQGQNSFNNGIKTLSTYAQMVKDSGGKLNDEQLMNGAKLLQNFMPGVFNVSRTASWIGSGAPQLTPRAGADTGQQSPAPEQKAAFSKWLTDDFAPAFLEGTGYTQEGNLPTNTNLAPQ